MNLKSTFFIVGLSLCNLVVRAQLWDSQGNNTVAQNPAILGMTNANGYNLAFYTNNTEKMRLTSGGFLGIGTTSPARLLDLSNNGSTPTGASLSADSMRAPDLCLVCFYPEALALPKQFNF